MEGQGKGLQIKIGMAHLAFCFLPHEVTSGSVSIRFVYKGSLGMMEAETEIV